VAVVTKRVAGTVVAAADNVIAVVVVVEALHGTRVSYPCPCRCPGVATVAVAPHEAVVVVAAPVVAATVTVPWLRSTDLRTAPSAAVLYSHPWTEPCWNTRCSHGKFAADVEPGERVVVAAVIVVAVGYVAYETAFVAHVVALAVLVCLVVLVPFAVL
jgi:hypothetical protein